MTIFIDILTFSDVIGANEETELERISTDIA
jgi:hypothetical protein